MKLSKKDTITVLGKRWFDKINGNTYHSVAVYVNGELIEYQPFTYGYEKAYEQTALSILGKKYELPESILWKLKDHTNLVNNVVDMTRKKDL